jgi:hypothetical protein
MPQLSPVDVLPSLGYRIDSQYFQPTFASDSSALEAASLSSALNDVQQALLEREQALLFGFAAVGLHSAIVVYLCI